MDAKYTRIDKGLYTWTYPASCKKINPISMDRKRRKEVHLKATTEEVESFRSLAGALLWLGSAVMPQAACIASFMQQKVTRLRVHDFIEANSRLKELRDLKPYIKYQQPEQHSTSDITVYSFSDASFNISASQSYGQTGMVTGLLFDANRGRTGMAFHPIYWSSSKPRRVSHSSYGAEIIACAEADDRGFHIKEAMQTMFQGRKITYQLNVDSKGLYDTITTLHEGKEYRLRQTVQRLRDSFESEELNVLQWIQGFANIADALTKHNPNSFRLISRVFSSGKLDLPRHDSYALESAEWK